MVGIVMFIVLPAFLIWLSFRIRPRSEYSENSALYGGLARNAGVEPDQGISIKEDEEVKFNL
ncbi:hypothetical protein [Deinococcus roseus]|uniref:Uncharacterized protein n=1 Tax=Deinococcus roseus TaxID=392414 RepID=A0ABQ2DFE5_9DEIO|nr:hypothetical protein [Deinococcus roseus]GGJ56193.1 hypothetical protein GCM10008938_47950 [Deinococcus roseus]